MINEAPWMIKESLPTIFGTLLKYREELPQNNEKLPNYSGTSTR
jgi:hypothetical protein